MSRAPRRKGPGRFVVLEGLDGAGTTTQLERVSVALRAEGHAVLATHQPSTGPIGMLLRQALTGRLGLPSGEGPLKPETLALLFAADRTDHLAASILPAMEEGKLILCDRYVHSSLAYQGAELPMAWVAEINRLAIPADLTLFLEIDVDTAAKRRALRGGKEEHFDAELTQRRIARRYRQALSLRQEKERIVVIDGTRSVEEVTDAILQAMRPLLARMPRRRVEAS